MTTPSTDRAHRWLRAALLALAAALAACGPGTGGTGTGPIHGTLGFSGNAGATILPTPGDVASLRLEAQRVELLAGCRRFAYTGAWEPGANGELLLEGTLETTTAAGTGSVPATLRLQFSEKEVASARVTAVVTGANGAALLGPLVLERADAAALGPAQCEPR
jgi:hypothetical protein